MTELRKITKLKWRQFLESPEGKEGLLFLREEIPAVRGEDMTSEQIIFKAGVSEGFRRAFEAISNDIIAADPKPETDPSND